MNFLFTASEKSHYLKFKYTNWRGDDHEYVIAPEGVSYGTPDQRWYLNGELILRDGDPREDMGPTRRRSFVIEDIRDPEKIPTQGEEV